jgi:hypothetical protein
LGGSSPYKEGGGNLQTDAAQLFLFVPIPAKAKKLGLLSIYTFSLIQTQNNFRFVKFVATKKGMTTNFLSPLSFVAVFGSGIRDRDPGWVKYQDLG